jgi:hypothetical protein
VDDLKMKRSVPERGTSLDAFGTSDAKILINGILKEGFLNEVPCDGRSRAEHGLGCGCQPGGSRLEISSAQIAITAEVIGMNTFHGGRA